MNGSNVISTRDEEGDLLQSNSGVQKEIGSSGGGGGGGGGAILSTAAPPSSSSMSWLRLKDPRIVRASRAFGGKDRHSKVCTVRGLRDRRVRLSVPTAIQLYELQDRLGLSQPSKVVDWLLNAAKDDIDDLPPLQIPPADFIQTSLLSLNKAAAGSAGINIINTSSTSSSSSTTTTKQLYHHLHGHGHGHEDHHHHHHDQDFSANLLWGATASASASDHNMQDHHHHHHHVSTIPAAAAAAAAAAAGFLSGNYMNSSHLMSQMNYHSSNIFVPLEPSSTSTSFCDPSLATGQSQLVSDRRRHPHHHHHSNIDTKQFQFLSPPPPQYSQHRSSSIMIPNVDFYHPTPASQSTSRAPIFSSFTSMGLGGPSLALSHHATVGFDQDTNGFRPSPPS
ncbi:hypothetical protein Dimus_031026 [Dionaea muscipula]